MDEATAAEGWEHVASPEAEQDGCAEGNHERRDEEEESWMGSMRSWLIGRGQQVWKRKWDGGGGGGGGGSSLAAMAGLMGLLMGLLMYQRRRHRREKDLLLLLNEHKDQRIRQLLDQIALMHETVAARRRIPVRRRF